MDSPPDLVVMIYTGNRKNAGTDNTVHIKLHSNEGKSSKSITLDHLFSNEFERGQTDTFRLKAGDLNEFESVVVIDHLELWKDRTLGLISDDWFVDKIVVENRSTNTNFIFPFFRWIKSDQHYHIKHLDTFLPQHDPYRDQRRKELEEKRKAYQYQQRIPGGPVQIKSLPPDEDFSFSYKWDISKKILQLKAKIALVTLFPDPWQTIDDMTLNHENGVFGKPRYVDDWKSDINFGRQRLAGVNSGLITVVKSIPDNFPVSDKLVGTLLGMTIAKAIEQKRLYITDLKILDGIPVKEGFTVCTPIALFFVDSKNNLVPVAIQLFQQPGGHNPIFTPTDPPMTWTLAKMWYNNAEAQHHQALAHLGLTHLMFEGFAIATHRHLSPSHPIFKILAPHFLYLIAINWDCVNDLENEEGWMNKITNVGSAGIKAIIAKGIQAWRLDVEGTFPEFMKQRGVDDPNLLPSYHYADDALEVFKAIHRYVHDYVLLYYKSPQTLQEDSEIQAWAEELWRGVKEGGCGYKGLPGNGTLTSSDDLVTILSSIIYTCSVEHAAVNFGQYDEFGFPPNYPALLKGKPPASKEREVTDEDIVKCLPNQDEAFNIMLMTKVMSTKGTFSLGNFEVQYIFDPKAIDLVKRFRADLDKISKILQDRNSVLNIQYDYLDPVNIPNSISI